MQLQGSWPWPKGLPQFCPHHPASGLWLLCLLHSTWGFTQTHSRTWAGQDPKTHENNPVPCSSPRTAGCRVISDQSHQTAQQVLPQRASWPCHSGGCSPVPGLQHRQWQGGNHLHLFLSPLCDTCHRYHSGLGIPEAVERAAPLGAPSAHPMAWKGLLGPFPGVPWEQSHSSGRCCLEPRHQETGGQRALCPRRFLSRHTGCLPAFVRSTKRGNSVPSRIANQAALAATAAATCAPLRATIGSSGAGRQDFCGLEKRPQHPPCIGVPSPCGNCGLFPFPQESSRHRWVQPDAVSRRRLPNVSLLLIHPQRAFPDSARARSGTPLGQACLGQRHA